MKKLLLILSLSFFCVSCNPMATGKLIDNVDQAVRIGGHLLDKALEPKNKKEK